MSRQKVIGECRVCGHKRELSFEHVPPRSAFNDRPVRVLQGLAIIAAGHDARQGRVQQRGSGRYTLCERCNNNTGAWYGKAFADWACHGLAFLPNAVRAPSLCFTYRIYPLRVVKQILCMFLSSNPPTFRRKHQYLEQFVLNRELRGLPPYLQIFCFLLDGPMGRQSGLGASGNLETGESAVFSEIAFRPYGYVLSVNSQPPDERLVDISFFANSSYDERREVYLRLPLLSVATGYAGDYRSMEEVARHVARTASNKALQRTALARRR